MAEWIKFRQDAVRSGYMHTSRKWYIERHFNRTKARVEWIIWPVVGGVPRWAGSGWDTLPDLRHEFFFRLRDAKAEVQTRLETTGKP